jgi:hypothetical protein
MRAVSSRELKELGEVVVGADLEANDAIDVFAPCGQQDDGNRGAPSKSAQDFEAVLLRKHHIENHELVASARRQIDGARTCRMSIDVEPFAPQELADEIARLPVVVDDEDRPRHDGTDCLRKWASEL